MSESLAAACPAKVNLFLRVLARETSGYHSLETLFCRLALADRLTVSSTESGIHLEVSGADLGPVEQNLAWRAADAVLQATGRRFGVAMQLEKAIPAQAGLGGGSSDAATALNLVNQLAGNAVPRGELLQMAGRLGSDVPFFMTESSLALAWGRGERLLTLPSLPPRPVLLVVPPEPVETRAAYGWLDEDSGDSRRGGVMLTAGLLDNWNDVARLAGNDFESPLFSRMPRLREAFVALAGTGPLVCRMSGSGSVLFAVYRSERHRDDAAMTLGTRHGKLISSATV